MSLTCPRCRLPLESVEVTPLPTGVAQMCPKCEGIWLENGVLDALSQLPMDGVEHSGLAPTLEANHQEIDLSPACSCPECHKKMDRYIFCSDSGVTVDRCTEHGIWLDDGEMAAVLQYLHDGDDLLKMLQANLQQEHRQRGFLGGLKRLFGVS